MANNEHTLKSIIQFSAESARDELNRINCARLEELLPDKEFQDLFSHICATDEILKTILCSISELMKNNQYPNGDVNNKTELNIDDIFNKEDSIFRLFYMIHDRLQHWRVENLVGHKNI